LSTSESWSEQAHYGMH